MDISENYSFYLPSRDGDDIADINQISDNFRKIDTELSEMIKGKGVDQTYDPTSKNPQSGTAVAGAVENFISREAETEWIFDGGDASGSIKIINPVDSEMSDTSNNAVQNKVVKEYVDDRSIDYIVEQGTDGVWTYRKWASGLVELWGWTSVLTGFTDKKAECHYAGVSFEQPTYPFALYGTLHIQFSLYYIGGDVQHMGYSLSPWYENTTVAPKYTPYSLTEINNAINVTGRYYIMARWKN